MAKGKHTTAHQKSSVYAEQKQPKQQNATQQSQATEHTPYSTVEFGYLTPDKGFKKGVRKNKKAKVRGAFIAFCVIAVICLGVLYIMFNPPFFSITLNGTNYNVNSGDTIQTLIDAEYAQPKPGNLLDVEGKVLEEGKGQAFVATINSAKPTSDPHVKLRPNDVISLTDGKDITEEVEEKKESIPFSTEDTPKSSDSYYKGSIHLFLDGQDGQKITKTGKLSGKTITKTLKDPVNAGYKAYSASVGDDKVVALTFDDGPWPETTEQIRQILKENDAHATFFVIGNQVPEHSETVKALAADGNQIACHSYDHAEGSGKGVNLTYMSKDEQIQEVEKGFKAIDDAVGSKVERIFRAPGGNYYGSLIETLRPYVTAEIGWDVDTQDWRRPGAAVIAEHIKSVQPGQIVLCHDGGGNRSQTVEALKIAIPYLKEQGYTFVTVSELLKYDMPNSGEDSSDNADNSSSSENS